MDVYLFRIPTMINEKGAALSYMLVKEALFVDFTVRNTFILPVYLLDLTKLLQHKWNMTDIL